MFGDDEEELSCDEENDDGFEDDLEALRRACTLTGTNVSDLEDEGRGAGNLCSSSAEVVEEEEEAKQDSSDDDFELFRRVQSRFSNSNDSSEPLSLKPLCSIHPDFEDDDDDFETLCAVRRRFSSYDATDDARRTMEKTPAENSEGVDEERAAPENDSSNDSSPGREICKVFPDTEDTSELLNHDVDIVTSTSTEQHQQDTFNLSSLGMRSFSSFPKSAQLFIDAIKRNRSCQKFLQTKLVQIDARMEENKKLKERVKILKDFQSSCRKSTGRALGQGKHPHVRLISSRKTANSGDLEVNGKKVSPMCYGPVENSHVANYREALGNFPVMLKEKKWTEEEKENLKKGIQKQFQEMVVNRCPGEFSGSDGILALIGDLEITQEIFTKFLPKVNWDELASSYVVKHTGAECEARWLNFENPLINHKDWTAEEDKKLLFIVQEKGMTNWSDIAEEHGKNRTPFQCLARFQRSLNARIIRREWTKEEDAQLRIAVETYGENDWQSVASALEGRTGPQCSNRWHKSIHPDISRVGRWTQEESARLKVAVMLFGPKNWRNIAHFVPGRTHVKCRERWFNCVDPSLKMDKWTEDEDLRLEAAIREHGYSWSKVAKFLAPRTDSQCLRRWKLLFPHEVPLLQAVRRTQKVAIISNFVDREADRPSLGPHDFVPQPLIKSASEAENLNKSGKRKRTTRKEIALEKDKNAATSNPPKRPRSKRLKERLEISSSQDLQEKVHGAVADNSCGNDTAVTKRRTKPKSNGPEADNCGRNDSAVTKRRMKPSSGKTSLAEHSQDDSLSSFPLPSATNSLIVYTRRKKKLPVDLGRNIFIQKEAGGDSQIQPKLHPVATEFADDCLHSNILALDNDGQVAVSHVDASCKITKLPVKRKVHTESANNVKSSMLPVGSSELSASNIEHDNSLLNGVSLNSFYKAPKRSRKRSSKSLEDGQGVDLVCNKLDEPRKSMRKSKSCTKQVSDPDDDGDVTLASFLQNKSWKRSCRVPENVNQACFVSKTEMRDHNGDGTVEDVILCATNDMQNTGVNAKDPSEEDMVSADSLTGDTKVRREQMSENHDVDLDISLASLLDETQSISLVSLLHETQSISLVSLLHETQSKRDEVAPGF
ncbi:myb domain protein 4r1 [Euphorbia peplus]|nr:myb domain protein 4r1 [Euphorbia peplus]